MGVSTSSKVLSIEQLIAEIKEWKCQVGGRQAHSKKDLRQNNWFRTEIKDIEYIESKRVFGALDDLLNSICQEADYERHGYLFLLDVPGSGSSFFFLLKKDLTSQYLLSQEKKASLTKQEKEYYQTRWKVRRQSFPRDLQILLQLESHTME